MLKDNEKRMLVFELGDPDNPQKHTLSIDPQTGLSIDRIENVSPPNQGHYRYSNEEARRRTYRRLRRQTSKKRH
ncbi:MAG: hypothetical protein PVJ52_00485 [Candidatus Woesebacteria bacterium]